MTIQPKPNTLYYGDCLEIMQQFPDEYVDLICLDPPFNSNAKYNNIFKNAGLKNIDPQIKAFEDIWTWDDVSAERVERIKKSIASPISKIITAFEMLIPNSKELSYISYMAERLIEMYRILKNTGSLYLHCDSTASHYLKLVLDNIFGEKQFRNEIIWQRTSAHNDGKQFGRIHDTILYYSKTNNRTWNDIYTELNPEHVKKSYKHQDEKGKYEVADLTAPGTSNTEYGQPWRGIEPSKNRQWNPPQKQAWPKGTTPPENYETLSCHEKLDILDNAGLISWPIKGKMPRFKRYLSTSKGRKIQDIITDINHLSSNSKEKMGYPTQKPVALYEVFIKSSTNEGDLVLDPFAGCGTTIDAAKKNGRDVIGIDVLPFALKLINERRLNIPFSIEGIPTDMETVEDMISADKSGIKFQDWAISLVEGLASNPKKTGDDGIDGFGVLAYKPDNMDAQAIIVQVTQAAGSQKHKFDKLQTDVRNHNAAMGILITKNRQTAQNRWKSHLPDVQIGSNRYRAIQCFSIEEYFENGETHTLSLPPLTNPWTGKPIEKNLFG